MTAATQTTEAGGSERRGRGSSPASLPRQSSRRARQDLVAASGFLAPFLALLLLFQFLPLFVLARNSLYDYTLFNPDLREFVGADNYVRVFTDPATVESMLVTFLFAAGLLVLVVPTAFLLAVYLNGRLPARALLRTMIFLPVVTSAVVVATLWTFMLNQSGLINAALGAVGVGPLGFLTETSLALPAIILMTVWQQVGLAAVLFLGGLQSIPVDVQEAALVDGAGPVRRLVSVTIPLLSPTTLLVVVVMTVFALQAFAPAYVMTGGAPEGSTNLLIYHIYRTAFFLQQPGFASAVSLVLLVVALGVSLVQMRLLRTRWNY